MFNLKMIGVCGITLALLFLSAPNLEARHCHHGRCRTSVNFNFGPVVPAPSYVVASPAYAPVYVPQPVVAYPVYQPVYVAPQPSLFTGFSFGWFFR